MIGAGWANGCANELFTQGWVTCGVQPVTAVDTVNYPYSAPTYPYVDALREEEEIIMLCRMFLEIIH